MWNNRNEERKCTLRIRIFGMMIVNCTNDRYIVKDKNKAY